MLTAAKGMRVLVGVIQFFCPSDIQSSCKAKKCHLFSGPCGRTENCKSSALVIRLRMSVLALSWVGTADEKIMDEIYELARELVKMLEESSN
jgi:hypothetical protein